MTHILRMMFQKEEKKEYCMTDFLNDVFMHRKVLEAMSITKYLKKKNWHAPQFLYTSPN